MLKRRFNKEASAQQTLSGKVRRRESDYLRIIITLSAALMLSACSNSGVNDLQSFIAEVKAGNPGQVEPLPELKPFEKYSYTAFLDELKDPFITWETINPKADRAKIAKGSYGDIFPDGERSRETLESYPLETLTMMGTLEYENVNWGLIKAPDGIVYRVKGGSYIGQNHGKISKVDSSNIVLVEIVSDGLGGWKNRPAELSLNDE